MGKKKYSTEDERKKALLESSRKSAEKAKHPCSECGRMVHKRATLCQPCFKKHQREHVEETIEKWRSPEARHLEYLKRKKPCKICGVLISPRAELCRKCMGEQKRGDKNYRWNGGQVVKKVCPNCKSEFYVGKKHKYQLCCSHKCRAEWQIKKRLFPECTQEEDNLGFSYSATGARLLPDGNPVYRNSIPGYWSWAQFIYRKYSEVCSICGLGDEITAHHLNCFSDYPDERVDVNNGVSICKDHHKEFHSIYGIHCTKDDFYEYQMIKEYDWIFNSV